jgi:tripartite-type tricarboxylate transporter receptor subunit TctC
MTFLGRSWNSTAWMGVSAVLLQMCSSVATVEAQNFPQRTIRLVTQEVGGGTDFAARQLAQGMSAALGQPVIVENRGGGGSISGEIVARASPDGHTLLVTGSSFWVSPLFRKAPYDPLRDFVAVSMLLNSPNVLVVPPAVPIKTVKDLIDMAKARPGALNYAAGTSGTITHLSAELFKAMARVNIVHVPYKGTGPAVAATVAGQVDLMFATSSSSAPLVKAGKLRAIAATSARPSALYPELPVVAATVPGYESGGATALFAPPGTPAVIVRRLHRETVSLLHHRDVKERFFNVGVETVAGTPEQLAASVKSEMTRLGKVIKDAGLRLE